MPLFAIAVCALLIFLARKEGVGPMYACGLSLLAFCLVVGEWFAAAGCVAAMVGFHPVMRWHDATHLDYSATTDGAGASEAGTPREEQAE